jgi:hypothetical protein
LIAVEGNCLLSDQCFVTSNGSWRFRGETCWGRLPEGFALGGTHGGIASDRMGRVYVSTQSAMGIVVFAPSGDCITTIAHQFPEVHSLVCAEEDGVEYLYATVLKGTPEANWLFVKMTLDGTPALRITAPAAAGFTEPNAWRITAAVPAPDGSLWIANGYGDSRLFHFDRSGNFLSAHAGKGSVDGLFERCHGLTIDHRFDQPLLLVCDRENHRLVHFDLDGRFVRTLATGLRRPCQASFLGDQLVVSELEGRVTILDRNHTPVAFLGDNPDTSQWAQYDIAPESITSGCFSAAHGIHAVSGTTIYISDWNRTGRVTRLELI